MGKGTKEIYNLHITGHELLPPPDEVKKEFALEGDALATVKEGHRAVKAVLDRDESRLIVVVGPCSIHNPEEALEYARKLKPLADELGNELLILMRVYFEKPRTTVGWKGLINDPDLNNTFQINKGLNLARQLLLDLADMGLPAGTEYLDLISGAVNYVNQTFGLFKAAEDRRPEKLVVGK